MATAGVTTSDLLQLATDIVAKAKKAGASDAECVIRESDEFSVLVRMGQVETLKESGARGVGLRVFLGKQSASTSSSDTTAEGIEHLVNGALALARVTSEDPFAGLPDERAFGPYTNKDGSPAELALFHEDVYSLPTEQRIEYAKRAEAASLAGDSRLINSDGGSFDAARSHRILANSRGFVGEYRTSYCGVSASPIATEPNGAMQRDYWYSSARTMRLLDTPESVGVEAARRTLRRLGGKRMSTQKTTVVFSPEIARSLLGHIFEAANGDSIWRSASFFAGQLNQSVADSSITVIDDGIMVLPSGVGGFGTSPFDGEGLPSRRTTVIENGVLKNYLLNSYTARKLGMTSTANASRGLAGNPGIGAGNLYMQPGTLSPTEILADVQHGLYVTELMGMGVNMVTGDYSRGAAGLLIENGELTHAVEEITIAGNLKDMFRNIVAIGNDLNFRGSTACPTLRIEGMTISGS